MVPVWAPGKCARMAVQILLALSAGVWLCLIYVGLGEALLRILGIDRQPSLFLTVLRFALGFGIVGNCVMVLCFAHLASKPGIIILLIILTGLALPFALRIIPEIIKRLWLVSRESFSHHPILSTLTLILLFGYGARGLLPPVEFDTLMYHLSTVKLYLEKHGFWHIYFNAQSDFPMLTEMNYLIGLALGNDIICKVISAAIGFVACAGIGIVARTWLGCSMRGVLTSILIFCTFTNTIANMSTCYVDMPQALWTLCAVLAMERYGQSRKWPWLIISAILAGMAMQTKIFGIFALAVIGIRFLQISINKETVVDILKKGSVICAVAILMGLPWYAKSYAYNGTILSLTHASIEGQGLATPMNIKSDSLLLKQIVNIPFRLIAAPWTFSLFPSQHQSDTFGPLLLAILPFLLFTKIPPQGRSIIISALLYFGLVLVMEMCFIQGGSSIRYSTYIQMIGAACIPFVISQLRDWKLIRFAMIGMVAIIIALGTLLFFKRYHKEWKTLLANKSREAYYMSVLPEYPVIKEINAMTDGKVVMPVYNYSDYLINVPFITIYKSYQSTNEMKQDLAAANVGYIYANNKLDTTENSKAFPELAEKEIIAEKNGFYLYKLTF
jgi:hypothetical protein